MNLEAILHEPPIELRWGGRQLAVLGVSGEVERTFFTREELQALHNELEDVVSPRRRQIMQILRVVADEFEVEVASLLLKRQPGNARDARLAAIGLVASVFGRMTDGQIAPYFACTASNISHARRTLRDMEDTLAKFKERMDRLRRKVTDVLFPKPQ